MDSSRRALQTNRKLFQIRLRIEGRKSKNIVMNSKAWILIKVQCFIYQGIHLDKLYKLTECFLCLPPSVKVLSMNSSQELYKLMESFFSNLILNFLPKTKIFSNE